MSPKHIFSLGKRSQYPVIFLIAAAALLTGVLLVVPPPKQTDFFLPAVAGAAGFAYFLYTQHLQETRLFADLFRQFNERYDKLNDRLNRIAIQGNVAILNVDEKQVLFDYFNLCGEEYLYFKTGFIDSEVWRSWGNGMRFFASVPHIRDLWISELEGDSYYGFTLECIAKRA